MADVQFEEEKEFTSFQSRKILGEPSTPKMYTLLKKSGIVKTDKQAYITLAIVACVFFLISLFIFLHYILGVGTGKIKDSTLPIFTTQITQT